MALAVQLYSQLVPMDEHDRLAVDHVLTRHPDFPKAGILFLDVFPLFRSPALVPKVVEALASSARTLFAGLPAGTPLAIAGLESRGFLHGVPLALALGVPFIGIRKAGKLPGLVEKLSYALEYGTATFEVSKDSCAPGTALLVCDDLLATGGSAKAATDLMERLGAAVLGVLVIVELVDLAGAAAIGKPVRSVLQL